ncbi:MAG: FeoA domain-containing protein, partial [Proteobacteria bacterium]|nr:FeoA domain-containing protein [Pseudomonadota bacterium]
SSDPEVDVILPSESSSVSSLDSTKRRLLEFGFIPGTIVKAMHSAPFVHDPISYLVRGTHVALRRSEASRVQIVISEGPLERSPI